MQPLIKSHQINIVYKYTYPACGGDDTVGYKVEVKPHPLKDVLEELYDLEGQHVLANIITNLEDTRLPNGRVTKRLREIT
jgi:hypothetical protein